MPDIRILPTVREVADYIAQKISFLPDTPLSRGDHTFDKPKSNQPELEFGE